MFKDFIKFNKLGSVIIAVLLGLFTILNIVFFTVYVKVVNSLHYISYRESTLVAELSAAINIMFVIIAAAMFIVAMLTFIGKSRSILLMHRGRSYYLKMQLLMITISSLITTGLYFVSKTIGVLNLTHMSFEFEMPQNIFINENIIIFMVFVFCGYIAAYYLVMYAIDVFANSVNRYQSIASRNADVLMFLVRSWLIGWFSVKLFMSPDQSYVDYYNPYRHLVLLDSTYIKWTVIFIIITLMVVLIVDYMCYFKKKVIV